jgi:hypothetical protein
MMCEKTEKFAYAASVILSSLSLLLIVVTLFIVSGNRSLQAEVNKRQAAINTATSLVQLNQSLVQALAEVAVSKDDKDVRDLLSSQGITVKKNDADQSKKK